MIEEFISAGQERSHDRSGGNSKCHLFGNYALLYGTITHGDIDKMIEIINKYNEEGISIARILEYKFDETSQPEIYDRVYQKGWTLEERAQGEELKSGREFNSQITDIENFDEEFEKYIQACHSFIEYVKKISEIDENWLDKFIGDYLRIAEEGKIVIDPSKPANFFYDEEKGFTFIDIGLANENYRTESKEMIARYIIVNLFSLLPRFTIHEKGKERKGEKIFGSMWITEEDAEIINACQNQLKEKLIRIFQRYNLNMEEVEDYINNRLIQNQYGYHTAENIEQLYIELKEALSRIIENNQEMGIGVDQVHQVR
ncbi:MAG: hypothetical protein IKF82_04975 [Bacilli bacterium]|nr:hypothetical protein [Bacilli bacterium]